MNEIEKLGAEDALNTLLNQAGKVDPFMSLAEKRWHLGKSHVAKGHDVEKTRLQTQGRGIGAAAGGALAGLGTLKVGLAPAAAASLLGAIAGGVAGYGAGGWEAGQRLRLSQTRGPYGHYSPGPRKHASMTYGGLGAVAPATNAVLGQSAKLSRSQIQGTKRAQTKVVAHKPMSVKTPVPQPPRVEPATQTPTQPPTAFASTKQAAFEAVARHRKKKATMTKPTARDRTSAGEPPTGGRVMRPGENMDMKHLAPSNEPITYTNGKPRDF